MRQMRNTSTPSEMGVHDGKICPFVRTNDFAYQDENVCCKHVTGTLPQEVTSRNHAVPVSASLLLKNIA